MSPAEPPLPHKLAAELARVRVAVARARDDLAEGRIPNLADLQSLVAGVCAATVEAARPPPPFPARRPGIIPAPFPTPAWPPPWKPCSPN